MPEDKVTLTTLFGDGEYNADGYESSYPLANQNSFTYSLVKYTQDQGQNPSNNTAFRLILDSPPDAIVSANIKFYHTQSWTAKDCPGPASDCNKFINVTADVFGKPSVNKAGLVFFPLKNHDGGAYVRAATECPCNDSTKSRQLTAGIRVVKVGGGEYLLLLRLIPCENCGEAPEPVARKQKKKPGYESSSVVERIDKSFDLLQAWNEYEI